MAAGGQSRNLPRLLVISFTPSRGDSNKTDPHCERIRARTGSWRLAPQSFSSPLSNLRKRRKKSLVSETALIRRWRGVGCEAGLVVINEDDYVDLGAIKYLSRIEGTLITHLYNSFAGFFFNVMHWIFNLGPLASRTDCAFR